MQRAPYNRSLNYNGNKISVLFQLIETARRNTVGNVEKGPYRVTIGGLLCINKKIAPVNVIINSAPCKAANYSFEYQGKKYSSEKKLAEAVLVTRPDMVK